MIPNGGWVKAVYHESIRLDLINKSKLNGEYGMFFLVFVELLLVTNNKVRS